MQFHLQVQGAAGGGSAHRIEIDAGSESEAIRLAVKSGWRVLAIDSPAEAAPEKPGKAHLFPLLQFSQELLTLLEAGLNLSEAITTLHAKETSANVKSVIGGILLSLKHGKSFSETLGAYPEIFSEIYIATVQAAERSGNMPEALGRFIGYQLQFDVIKKKLVSAAIYPLMLLGVGGLVTLFLLGYVVPKFAVVYETSGRDIPWASQVLLGFGKTIAENGFAFLAALGSVLGGIVFSFANPAMRRHMAMLLLKLPVLSVKAGEFRLARFYRSLSLLLHAGIPLSKGMAMVSALLLPNQQEQLRHARRAVAEGLPFSAALEQNQLSTAVAQSLIKVGENTGRLGDMLERSAKFHDEEFARWVDTASRLLEPLLMTVIGIVIGAVVVLMYMPIFELAGSLS